MSTEQKVAVYNNLFMSVIFGILFSLAGGIILNGSIDWSVFGIQAIASAIVGFVIGLIIPVGKWSMLIAEVLEQPGTYFYKLISAAVLLIVLLFLMLPIITIFMGVVVQGVSVESLTSSIYVLFVPFLFIGLMVVPLISGPIMKLSMKCAGMTRQNEVNVTVE